MVVGSPRLSAHGKFRVAAVVVGLKILLEATYIARVSSYHGFPLIYSHIREIESLILLLAVIFSLPDRQSLSSAIMKVLTIFLILPITTYYAFAGGSRGFAYLSVGAFLLTVTLVRKCSINMVAPPDPPQSARRALPRLVIIHAAIVYVAVLFSNGMPPLESLLYQDTYQIRGGFTLPHPVFAYLFSWQVLVFNPFLIGYYWVRSNYKGVVGIGGLVILAYLFSPAKLNLVGPLFAAVLVTLYQRNEVLSGLSVLSATAVIGGWVAYLITGIEVVLFQAAVRLFYIPGRIQFLYFDYFQNHPHVLLTNTPLNPVSSYPFERPVPFVVSDALIGSAHNANAGYLADAYAQLGSIGVISFSIFLAIGLVLLDWATQDYQPSLIVAACAMPAWLLTQNPLTVSVLTNGFVVIGVLALLCRPTAERSDDQSAFKYSLER